VIKIQNLIPWIQNLQKMIQERKQLADGLAPKTDLRELLPPIHGAINEMAFGCINVQTANMVTIGSGGILIAAPEAKAMVAHALTINPLRSIHASN